METPEIRCPKCNSNQITANKKGFSGGKAVAGAVLTGGIGILAGTIGSGKVVITCLACGNKFKPGEGRLNTPPPPVQKVIVPLPETPKTNSEKLDLDKKLIEVVQASGKLRAVEFYKMARGGNTETAKKYVESVMESNESTRNKKDGCFIATACYGNYDAPEVLILRQYRDQVLLKRTIGRVFIAAYYRVSPFFASIIAKSDRLKRIAIGFLIEPIVKRLR